MNPDEFVNQLFNDLDQAASITAPVLVIGNEQYTPAEVAALDMTAFTDDELATIAGFQRTHARQYVIMPKHDRIHALVPAGVTIIEIVYEDAAPNIHLTEEAREE